MEKLAGILIFVGAIFWVTTILFLDGRWEYQLFAAVILAIGIFVAHLWEEVFRDKE